MNKLKKNWQLIVIVLLLLFSVSKCTQSCNRQGLINKQTQQIEMLDSLCTSQDQMIQFLIKDTADYLNQIRMYQGFDKHRNYTDSINNANLQKQREQTQSLVNQNQSLIKKLNEKEK